MRLARQEIARASHRSRLLRIQNSRTEGKTDLSAAKLDALIEEALVDA
jgi:hypothetical protein